MKRMDDTPSEHGLTRTDGRTGRLYVLQGRTWKLHWSPDMTDWLRRRFPTTRNSELAAALGVSLRAMRRKASEMGLRKDRHWLRRQRTLAMLVARSMHPKHGARKEND